MKKLITGCLASMALFAVSCTQSANNEFSQADKESLLKTHSDIVTPLREHLESIDLTAFVNAHYAEDAIMMAPNSAIVEGRAAIIAMAKSRPPLKKFTIRDVEVEGSGNLAFIRGAYELTVKMNDTLEVSDTGKSIEIWKKNDKGEWKCIRDIFNSDIPAKQ